MHNTEYNPDFSQKILSALDSQKVEPKPRWHFMVQEGSVWLLGAAATFCGAMAVSATLFVIVTAPMRLHPATHESVVSFWMDFAPVVWLALFGGFVILADYVLRQTKRGYRYNILLITVSSAMFSIILGYVGFLAGVGEFLESGIGKKIPFHTPVQVTTARILNQPEHGIITGMVEGSGDLLLRINDQNVFKLDVSQVPDFQQNFFIDGSIVSVIGTTTASDTFTVCMVIPITNEVIPAEYFESERKSDEVRNNVCKGVRPYQRLQTKLLMNYEHK